MRILVLVLCAAAFAGGLLAGSLVFTSDDARQRSRATHVDGTHSRTRVSDIEGPGRADAVDAEDLSSGETPLRELAGDAAAALERGLRSEAATAFLDGDGKITGTVRDPAGEPVAGVVVTASPQAKPFDLALRDRRVRERPHEDRDIGDTARAALQGELWRRRVRQVATTDSGGRFVLERLVKGGHLLAAYHEDYLVKPVSKQNKVQPDAVVDFVAQPVIAVRVDVRLPDGEMADYAWVSWRGPHGSGWETWKPDEGKVRLPVGDCTVKAQTWVPDPLHSAEVEHTVGPANRGDALVLQLEGRRILTARLVLPLGFDMPDSIQFRLRRVESGNEVDPASLRKEDFQKNASSSAPGRGVWYDLEPGRYLVAAFLSGKRLLGHAEADLGDGATEVALPMEMPAAGSYIAVKLVGPGGGPIRRQTRFHILTGLEVRVRWHRAEMLRQTDGTWLALIPEVDPKAGYKAAVRAHTEYGVAQAPFDLRRPGAVTLRFDEPGHVGLRVDRYAGSGVEGRLHAALVGDQGTAVQRQVRPDGTCDLRGVQPGEYSLVLFVRAGDNRWPILRRRIALRKGEREQSVSVPPLHVLRVRPNPRLRVRMVTLRSSDPELGSLRRRARPVKGVATFGALAAGAYEIECGRKRVKIRVPGPPEVRVD